QHVDRALRILTRLGVGRLVDAPLGPDLLPARLNCCGVIPFHGRSDCIGQTRGTRRNNSARHFCCVPLFQRTVETKVPGTFVSFSRLPSGALGVGGWAGALPARLHSDPRRVAAVWLGGALGALVRTGLGDAFPPAPHAWPWPTFIVNLAGSL